MLQLPINVYPQDTTIDPDNDLTNDISFTFKGDFLKAYVVRFYDYNTNEVDVNDTPVYEWDSEYLYFKNIAYNNDVVRKSHLLDNLSYNKEYIMKIMLVEGTIQQSGLETNRFVLRGTTVENASSGDNVLKIEDKINFIYEWCLSPTVKEPFHITVSDIEYDLGLMTIAINDKIYKILSYNYETGELTIDRGLYSAIEEGTPYKIYANYLITEDYYFKTAMTPVLTNLYADFDSEGIHFTGRCNNLINCYTIKMQKKSDSNVYMDVFETDKIYSNQIEYDFLDDYDPDELDGGNVGTRKYRFIVNAITRNGFDITGVSNDFTMPERTNTDIIKSTWVGSPAGAGYVHIQWETESGLFYQYRIYRVNDSDPHGYDFKKLVGVVSSQTGLFWNFFDYSISKKGKYRYVIVPYTLNQNEEVANAVVTDEIQIDQIGYTITAITYTGMAVSSIPFYLYNSQGRNIWTFLADVDESEITQNLDNTLHVGYGKYSSKTSTDVNYLSGQCSAYLGQVSCYRGSQKFKDDLDLVRAWREFVSQDCLYILQTPKGDALLVNIVENPSTKYEENLMLSTKFTFSWAECGDLNGIMIGDRIPENAKPIE